MRKFLGMIGDQTLGFLFSLFCVINLALGSLVMNMNPKVYPPFFMLDFALFFDPPKTVHFWFYLLLFSFFLLGINTLACSLESLLAAIEAKSISKKRLAGLLFHLGLLLALLAHLHEGIQGEHQRYYLTDKFTEIKGIGKARLVGLETLHHPDGSKKDSLAQVEFMVGENQSQTQILSYNNPALFSFGTKELSLLHAATRPAGIILKDSTTQQRFEIAPKSSIQIGQGTLTLYGIMTQGVRVPFGYFLWRTKQGQTEKRLLALDHSMKPYDRLELGDKVLFFDKMKDEPFLAAQYRYNPSLWIMVVAVLATLAGSLFLFRKKRRDNFSALNETR